MRLLVVNWHDWHHPHAGGAEVHLREVALRWIEAGHRVTLLCSGEAGRPRGETEDGIRIVRAGLRPTFNWALPRALRRLLREPVDLVVEDLNKIPLYLPLLAAARPTFVLAHHLFGSTAFLEANPAVASYVWLGERGLPRAYRRTPFVAVSASTRDDLVERGIAPENVEVVHGGIRFPPPGLALRRSPHPTFTYLGRIKRYKQIELALAAFARVLPDVPAARFAVAGYGDHTSALAREAARLGVADRVTFHGRTGEPEKWRILGESWGFLYTSPKEGWGLSSVEAQAAGVPVIASDSPGLRETLLEGRSGFLVPHGDVEALAARMRTLAADRDRVERMGDAARAFAAPFTWERSAARLLDAFERRLRWRRIEREGARAAA
ncbi:MAG TPA: glycosyltransferase family 4 protein [Gemmatimonadota bacterium]|jgi:glycosyltransferase involved in cell wall biosynthesis